MSRRANGDGSLYRRQDGRWTGATYVLRPDGGRVRRQVYGKTRSEVRKGLAELQQKTAQGIPLATAAWTFESYADHWLAHVAEPSLKPATVASYRGILRLHVLPTLGSVSLRSVSVARVRQLVSTKSQGDLSPRTVALIHATIRTVLSSALNDELVERNVATLVRPPRQVRKEVTPWTPAEAAAFLTGCRDHRLYALFAVGVSVGLRRGELLGLRWVDVDFESGQLHVRETVQRIQGKGLVIGPPKSARSQRVVLLPDSCVETLRRHRVGQAQEKLAAGREWQDSGRVFASSVGTILEPRNLSRLFDELVRKANVPRIRFHDLRHTCASLLLAQNVPPRVVMEVLGHSQLAITMDLYSHVMPTALREAASAMDRALGN